MISKELRDRHMRMCQKFMMLRLDSLFSDLPRGEFMPLQTIYAYSLRNPGTKGIYVYELASQLKVSSPAVSRTLRSLETKGYIERSADKNDRRSTLIRLTEKGDTVRKQVFTDICDYFDRVFDRMGPARMEQLIGLWDQLHTIMEDELKMRQKRNAEQTAHDRKRKKEQN